MIRCLLWVRPKRGAYGTSLRWFRIGDNEQKREWKGEAAESGPGCCGNEVRNLELEHMNLLNQAEEPSLLLPPPPNATK